MSLTTGGMGPADFAALNGNNGFGNGNDLWIFLLFLLVWGNGWGNNGYAGGYGSEVQQGFDQAAVMGAIQSAQSAIQSTAADTLAGINSLAMTMQNCCCENRLATANLGAQVAADGCATRQSFNEALRDMQYANFVNSQNQIAAINAVGTNIDNKLCQLEMDAKNDKIADLQRQLEQAEDNARYNGLIAAMNASQDAQTTTLEQYLAPTPRPAYFVPNPNCCGCQTQGSMCGY